MSVDAQPTVRVFASVGPLHERIHSGGGPDPEVEPRALPGGVRVVDATLANLSRAARLDTDPRAEGGHEAVAVHEREQDVVVAPP